MKELGKSIIKFGSSFRQSMKDMGWSEEETRQLELEVIKHQRDLREGVATTNKEERE